MVKIDEILGKFSSRFNDKSVIAKGLIYGFYDYLFGKILDIKKYRDNKKINAIVSYIKGTFKCNYIKLVKEDEDLDAERFLGEVFSVKSQSIYDRELGVKEFVSYVRSKGKKIEDIEEFKDNYTLLSFGYKGSIERELNNIAVNENIKYKCILIPSKRIKSLYIKSTDSKKLQLVKLFYVSSKGGVPTKFYDSILSKNGFKDSFAAYKYIGWNGDPDAMMKKYIFSEKILGCPNINNGDKEDKEEQFSCNLGTDKGFIDLGLYKSVSECLSMCNNKYIW